MTDFETHPVGTTAMIKSFWEEFDAKDKRIAELEADLAEAEARVKVLEMVLRIVRTAINPADMADGVCCCGEDMLHHPEPLNCGHTPVDAGEYSARLFLTSIDAALAQGGAA